MFRIYIFVFASLLTIFLSSCFFKQAIPLNKKYKKIQYQQLLEQPTKKTEITFIVAGDPQIFYFSIMV